MEKPIALKFCRFVDVIRSGNYKAAAAYLEYIILHSNDILKTSDWEIIEKAICVYGNESKPEGDSFSSKNGKNWFELSEKLLKNEKINVLFLNDIGFNAGAGIGVHRQVQSFLNNGDDVSLLAFHNKPDSKKADLGQYKGRFLNAIDCSECISDGRLTDTGLKKIVGLVIDIQPDLIITGNFHARGLQPKILDILNDVGCPIVAYAHDCDWVTGGCAHFLYHQCNLYLSGCKSEECPKHPESYPPVNIKNISKNWCKRSDIFSIKGIPLAVNSEWMKKTFVARFGSKAYIDKVTLGLNTQIYKPLNKKDAKKKLGLDPDSQFILAGSGFLGTRGKGNEYLLQLFEKFKPKENVLFGLLGNSNDNLFPKNVKHLGYVTRDNDLALIYSAADIFVNPVTVEAFGQTMLEAIACGCPVISFNECGVGEISVDGLTGIHCANNIDSLAAEILNLIQNPEKMNELQKNGRYIVEEYFSLEAQLNHWREFLIKIAYLKNKAFLNDSPNLFSSNDLRFNNKTPVVTVVTVTYNVGNEFIRTANSIMSQKNIDYEWIVIDGNSNEKSLSILNKYKKFFTVFVSEKDNGIYDAMNKSIEYAKGDYVIFIGSGDSFTAHDSLFNFSMNVEDKPDVVYGNVFELRQNGNVLPTHVVSFEDKWRELKKDVFPPTPIMRGLPPHQATFVRLNVLKKIHFDLSFKVSADWDLIFKLYSLGYKFKKVNITFAWYPNGGFSAVHSVQWLKDVRAILSKYCDDNKGMNSYFDRIEINQRKIVEGRIKECTLKEKYNSWIENDYSW